VTHGRYHWRQITRRFSLDFFRFDIRPISDKLLYGKSGDLNAQRNQKCGANSCGELLIESWWATSQKHTRVNPRKRRRDGREIALFFTGIQYAGENLADVLKKRAQELGPPIQMCDGLLTRNLPKEFETIVGNCCAHARRDFVDLASRFPEECRYVLETFREVYKNDALAKERGMSAEERLAFHQTETGPLMAKFETWLKEQITEKRVEPNSGLGQAISYVKNHWRPVTVSTCSRGSARQQCL